MPPMKRRRPNREAPTSDRLWDDLVSAYHDWEHEEANAIDVIEAVGRVVSDAGRPRVQSEDVAATSLAPDCKELLAFILGRSEMPADDWRARFPVWSKMTDEARRRFAEETDRGRRAWARSSAMVSSEDLAIHYWVFLPLIRDALAPKDPSHA